MAGLTQQEATQREGWAIALVDRAFPNLRQYHPVRFDTDVRLLFEYSLAHPHADRTDPFNLKKHGTYSSPHAAEVASDKWLHAPKQSHIFTALEAGNTDEAARLLRIPSYAAGPKLPQPLHKGVLSASKPGTWHDIGQTLKKLPGAAVHDAGVVGKDAGHVAVGAGHVAGDVLGGIGGFFKNPVTLIIIVLVLVLVIKK